MNSSHPAPAFPVDLIEAGRVAAEAAEAAGDLLRARMAGPLDVHLKGTGVDVVTDLDLACEELILERIGGAFPGHLVISEEAGAVGAGDSGFTWLVDPLDGTNNVAIGMPVCAVGLALCEGPLPVLGVVHEPVSRRTWRAVRGEGAVGPDGTRLRLPDQPRPGRADKPVLAWIQGHDVGSDDAVAVPLKAMLERRGGRLLQLWAPLVAWVMLARGDIDGIVGYRPELIDLPAGALLAQEAGAELRALDGGPYRPSIELPPAERGFVAARPELLGRLLHTAEAALDPAAGVPVSR
ncbi:inositol monophosphatase family protein [Actinomadura rudentiformis]|uniref:Inositol monophosphatase n=1 Tax=Actinomadura rudentiformis TaxID=359158 RepID=A0A6H9YBP4_9ACTN|nr:inositol monophosphatase [Actinomadura rudentiformis]KAB2342708.1 inositol monophosphatase [Actinomadura rudentiformis]